MAEFSLVERDTRLSEAASGCELHRDPASGKVKLLQLGIWRGTLEPDDLPPNCRYIAFSEHLDMLGVPLFASFKKTRQNSGEELKEKLRKKAGPWSTKNMPLLQRSFSTNCYLLPKVWYRCIKFSITWLGSCQKYLKRKIFIRILRPFIIRGFPLLKSVD